MYNQVIAAKAFTAFDGVVIHGIEYGIEDYIIFSQISGFVLCLKSAFQSQRAIAEKMLLLRHTITT